MMRFDYTFESRLPSIAASPAKEVGNFTKATFWNIGDFLLVLSFPDHNFDGFLKEAPFSY